MMAARTVAEKIVELARDSIGSKEWAKEAPRFPGKGRNKCNVFVADVVTSAGGKVPQIYSWQWSPVGTGEWANHQSTYMPQVKSWVAQSSCEVGDISAFDGHMGIVTGHRLTTSATEFSIVQNDWGFRPGQSPTFWRWVS